ncbi:hypothetical protein [Anaerovibrio sp.]|uniref:hypothetical protein n=1 Tax=Anaerovibrio sp. TaxID=1872532 RepID=UPI00388E3ED9
MLKKGIGIFLAASILMGPMVNDCEAGSNIWNDIGKFFSSGSNSSNRSSSRQQSDPAPKQIEFNLDGRYSRIQFDNTVFQKTSFVSEHYFTVDKPSEVDLHFIGHTHRYFYFYVFDSDQNKLGSQAGVLENSDDKTLILRPGRYVIKTKVDHNNGQNKKDIDYEVKGTMRNIPVTVDVPNYSRHDAVGLFFGEETVDYMPVYDNDEQDQKYYKIVLQTPTTINILIDKLSKKCSVYFELLDEDERLIDYLNDFRDNHLIYSKALNAGTYYLKVKRAGTTRENDGAYSIRIK